MSRSFVPLALSFRSLNARQRDVRRMALRDAAKSEGTIRITVLCCIAAVSSRSSLTWRSIQPDPTRPKSRGGCLRLKRWRPMDAQQPMYHNSDSPGLVSSLFVPKYPASRIPHAASCGIGRMRRDSRMHTNGAANSLDAPRFFETGSKLENRRRYDPRSTPTNYGRVEKRRRREFAIAIRKYFSVARDDRLERSTGSVGIIRRPSGEPVNTSFSLELASNLRSNRSKFQRVG